jgi:hypothetical protein
VNIIVYTKSLSVRDIFFLEASTAQASCLFEEKETSKHVYLKRKGRASCPAVYINRKIQASCLSKEKEISKLSI